MEEECPICLEKFKNETIVSLECCSKQRIHIECYIKSLPRCPFCRSEQPKIFPIIVIKNDWSTATKKICATIFFCAFISIAVLSGSCSQKFNNMY